HALYILIALLISEVSASQSWNTSVETNATCCEALRVDYRQNWLYSYRKLTGYLESLKTWNCEQFQIECSKRYFSVDEFSSSVYLHFCEPEQFENQTSNLSVPTSPYNATALPSPIQQIMQYESSQSFVEINSFGVPFCGIVWCGFDVETYQVLKVSIGSCLPTSCRSGTYVIMAVCGILAVVIVLANATVIVVFCRSRKPWSTQTVYKLSMAIADLLVGLFVF
uniref:G-protein coupled receptors family 1 profile domain-containing protein n=2 Tax=Ciona intestinalis TaxID=7719 RepID=H2Y393_CIOIN